MLVWGKNVIRAGDITGFDDAEVLDIEDDNNEQTSEEEKGQIQ